MPTDLDNLASGDSWVI